MTPTTRIAAIAALLVAVSAGTAGIALAGDNAMPGLRLGADAQTVTRADHEGLRLGADADAEVRARFTHERRRGSNDGFMHRLRLKGLGMLESVREDFKNMTPEDRASYREEAAAFRAEQKTEWEAFVGTDGDGLRDARKEGLTMGDVLEARGHDRTDAEVFLEARSEDRIGFIDAHHDLTAEEETTLRDRFSGWVDRLLDRWFR